MATDETAKKIENLKCEILQLGLGGIENKGDVNDLIFELTNIIDQLEAIEFEEDED